MKYLIVKGYAGVGNRIETLLSSILYAKLSGRILHVDWSDPLYSPLGTNIFKYLVEIVGVEQVERLPKSVQKHAERESAQWTNFAFGKIDHPNEVLKIHGPLHVIETMRPHFEGRFDKYLTLSALEILADLLSTHLRLHPSLREAVRDFKETRFKDFTIGVHVRYTDAKRPRAFFDRATELMLQKYPNASIYLATDNEAVIKEFQNKFPRVITRDKWFPAQNGITLYGNKECPDRLQGVADALIEMWLLAECDALVCTGCSTFSTVARAYAVLKKRECFDIEKFDYFVSVIVPSLNVKDEELLLRCAHQLSGQTYPKDKFEVLIPHRGISEETEKKIRSLNMFPIDCRDSQTLYGLRNAGLSAGRGEVFAILTPDCVPPKNWIEAGVRSLRREGQSIAAIYGKILPMHSRSNASVELYQNYYVRFWRAIIKGFDHKNFMHRWHFSFQHNLFFYRHIIEHTGDFCPDVNYIGDLLWWERFKNRTSYFFKPVEGIDVRSPNSPRKLGQLFRVITAFTEEYYRHRERQTYPLAEFFRDQRLFARMLLRVMRIRRIESMFHKLKLLLVLCCYEYFRLGRRLWVQRN